MALDICGDGAIFMPETGCDDCEQFTSRLEAVEDALDTKSPILAAGDGITLTDLPDGRVEVASEGEAYTAGDGIEISTANVISSLRNPTNTYTKSETDANITALSTALSTQIAAKQDTLTAGNGIDITNNVVSAERNPTNTYTKAEVDALIAELEHVHMEEVATLPATGDANIIYLVPKTGGGYEMWVWANNAWKSLGGTDIDLSNYATKAEATYTAGTGLKVANNVFSTNMPRLANPDPDAAVNLPPGGTVDFQDGPIGDAWFSRIVMRSADERFWVQLVFSYTNDLAYYRRCYREAPDQPIQTSPWMTLIAPEYGVASPSANGLMSAADKVKLDGIAYGAKTFYQRRVIASVTYSLPGAGNNVTVRVQAARPNDDPRFECASIAAYSSGSHSVVPTALYHTPDGLVTCNLTQVYALTGNYTFTVDTLWNAYL